MQVAPEMPACASISYAVKLNIVLIRRRIPVDQFRQKSDPVPFYAVTSALKSAAAYGTLVPPANENT
jgi:hypothetical protein